MQKATWTLQDKVQGRAAFDAAYKRAMPALGDGMRLVLELRPERRSDVQSAKFHAMMGELSKRYQLHGRKLTLEQWKQVVISAHSLATGEMPDMIRGLEGEMLNIRESSARMSVARMASLIEYVQAYCAMNDMEV